MIPDPSPSTPPEVKSSASTLLLLLPPD
ncbi:hypothetical protein LINGRAHAP2_LOCUS34673 [Linum grandiflorum]